MLHTDSRYSFRLLFVEVVLTFSLLTSLVLIPNPPYPWYHCIQCCRYSTCRPSLLPVDHRRLQGSASSKEASCRCTMKSCDMFVEGLILFVMQIPAIQWSLENKSLNFILMSFVPPICFPDQRLKTHCHGGTLAREVQCPPPHSCNRASADIKNEEVGLTRNVLAHLPPYCAMKAIRPQNIIELLCSL